MCVSNLFASGSLHAGAINTARARKDETISFRIELPPNPCGAMLHARARCAKPATLATTHATLAGLRHTRARWGLLRGFLALRVVFGTFADRGVTHDDRDFVVVAIGPRSD